MLFRFLVFLYPAIRTLGPATAAVLVIAGLSLIGYAILREPGLWSWLAAVGCLLTAALLALLCHSYHWWLFKLRPRGSLFIPFK
ncbi:hypothetical protein [Pseudomonas sp. TCU-HL1]|uniref:hypothetical protein n=1 Tax=Pseudomonas sp. TCU-HL1 TaxID=1856685 RepID=UPI00083D77A0|nr:hypothetical protein [Pseudomonas sp. TCU-HL1]AOE87305.1 hypothetical protein THL1_4757 [Pseudomonas sp. TCU-HL1]